MISTPIRAGDRVHNAVEGVGTVKGFAFPEGRSEQVLVEWDVRAGRSEIWPRMRLRRVVSESDGVLRLGA